MSKEINPGYGWVPDNRAVEPEGKASHSVSDWESLVNQAAASNQLAGKLINEINKLRPLFANTSFLPHENIIVLACTEIEASRARQQAAQAPQTCAGCNETVRKLEVAEARLKAIDKALCDWWTGDKFSARALYDAVSMARRGEK